MLSYVKSWPGVISIIGVVALALFGASTINSLAPTPITVNDIMRIVISLVVLGSSLYVILSNKYPTDTLKWAFGIIGVIVGYWLPA
jgi:hypothetical protein